MKSQEIADRAFLSLVLWREARGESDAGKIGVAMAILNRVARPSWWGHNITEVLFKKWQFSSMTDPHDPQLSGWPLPNDPSWVSCLDIACRAADGQITNPIPGADSYFDQSISAPPWTATARFVAQIGKLKFYDVDHDYQN